MRTKSNILQYFLITYVVTYSIFKRFIFIQYKHF